MEEEALLINMAFLLLVGGVCSVVFKRLKMPPIIGYLVTGIILANYWVGESETTETIVSFLAHIGLVMLMFCIGMELNLKKLRETGTFAMIVVLIQLPIMIVGGYLFGMMMGWNAIQCIFFGAIISGSSTAVVTAVLRDQGKLSKSDVETIILITVIEDVAQVLILSMASPLLTGDTVDMMGLFSMLLVVIVFISVSIFVGIRFIPQILDWINDRMPNEILLMASLGGAFAFALLSVYINLSMAIGAFLFGVIVSQAKCRVSIEHDVIPMKDIFMAMFFISVGLEITPDGVIGNIVLILLIFGVYAILKLSSVFFAYFLCNRPVRLSLMSAAGLVAMGEFAFIIAKAALDANVVDEAFYTSVIGAALVSMIALPLLTENTTKMYEYAERKSPQPVLNFAAKINNFRSAQYNRLTHSSVSTVSLFRNKAIIAYAFILVLILIEAAFVSAYGLLRDVLMNELMIGEPVVMFALFVLNIAILALPAFFAIKNLKFVSRIIVDAERKAADAGEGDTKRKAMWLYRKFNLSKPRMLAWVVAIVIVLLVPLNPHFLAYFINLLTGMDITYLSSSELIAYTSVGIVLVFGLAVSVVYFLRNRR